MRKFKAVLAAVAVLMMLGGTAQAGTTVRGHSGNKTDADGNGYPDAGKQVVGHYTESYVDGDTTCEGRVNYRGDFGNDEYLNSGVIDNHWLCRGPEGTNTYHYQIVHQTDPRYRGNPDWAVWGEWEYHVLTESGNGNLVRPYEHSS